MRNVRSAGDKRTRNGAALSVLWLIALLFLASCGGGDATKDDTPRGSLNKEWVYVPEFLELRGWEGSPSRLRLFGDVIYGLREGEDGSQAALYRYALSEKKGSFVSLEGWDHGDNGRILDFAPAQDGGVFLLASAEEPAPNPGGGVKRVQYLCGFGPEGALTFFRSMEELLSGVVGSGAPCALAVDGEGRPCVGGGSLVWLFDGEGNCRGAVSVCGSDSRVTGLCRAADGGVYAVCVRQNQDAFSPDSVGYDLMKPDFDEGSVEAAYSGLPASEAVAGGEESFLLSDGSIVYEYREGGETGEPIFRWLDSDIEGGDAALLGVLEDGRVAAAFRDWGENGVGIALLTKTRAAQAVPRETLLVGAMTADSRLRAAVVRFNRGSSRYRAEIKEYYSDDISWGGMLWQI